VGDGAAIAERITQLPSGLRVVTEHVPGALSVSVGVWVGVGARDEPASICGASHFLEHLLFKGTPTRSAKEIANAIDRIGGDMNAFTTREFTAYHCRVPARKVGVAVQLLGEVVSSPALRDVDVDSERQVILEELAMDTDSPDDTAYRLFEDAMFPGHPLGRPVAGHVETVEAITTAQVRGFFESNYRQSDMVLAVAGALDHDHVVALAEQAFTSTSQGQMSRCRERPSGSPQALTGEERDSEQVHLVIGLRGVDRFDADREALDIVTHVLGGGPSSRLFQRIREERGLAYSTFAAAAKYSDAGLVSAYAATAPEHADEVMSLLTGELDTLLAEGVSDEELEIATGALSGAYAMGFEGSGARAERLGIQMMCYGEVRPIEEQAARWEAVTLDDVRRVTERLAREPRVRCSVGPVDPASFD